MSVGYNCTYRGKVNPINLTQTWWFQKINSAEKETKNGEVRRSWRSWNLHTYILEYMNVDVVMSFLWLFYSLGLLTVATWLLVIVTLDLSYLFFLLTWFCQYQPASSTKLSSWLAIVATRKCSLYKSRITKAVEFKIQNSENSRNSENSENSHVKLGRAVDKKWRWWVVLVWLCWEKESTLTHPTHPPIHGCINKNSYRVGTSRDQTPKTTINN